MMFSLKHTIPLLLLVSTAAAQIKSFHGTVERQCAQVLLYTEADGGFSPQGMVTLEYGPPEWKAEYAGMIDKVKPGTRQRFGKDGWASLDTNAELEVAGQKIPAGQYYLAIELTEKGKFGLVLVDAQKARADKLLPFASQSIKGGIVIPLTAGQDNEEPVKQLEITLTPDDDDAKQITLAIRWGKFHVHAKLHANVSDQ